MRDNKHTEVLKVDGMTCANCALGIRKHLEKMASTGKVPPITVESPEEDVKKGAPKTYTVPILFDNSDFFASQS